MAHESPSSARINDFVFGSGDDYAALCDEEIDSPEPEPSGEAQRRSMYVSLFEDALATVLENESHLFSPGEIVCFKRYNELSYNARYLLIRLCLRKTDKWHRISNLKYQKEIGDTIPDAIRELCHAPKTSHYQAVKPEIIDLTLEELVSQKTAGPSQLPPLPPPVYNESDFTAFADDHVHAELSELLDCLTMDELRALAKTNKIASTGKRDVIISALLKHSSGQTILTFPTISTHTGGGTKRRGGVQSTLAFPIIKKHTHLDRLRVLVMERLHHCIRLNSEVVKLFQRVNLVYFRNTQHTPTLLTPSILSRARKRTYAAYVAERTLNIWPTRESLLEYEKALELEAEVDTLLDGSTFIRGRSRSVASKTPMPTRSRPSTESPRKLRSSGGDEDVFEITTESPRVLAAKGVKEIFEKVFPKWKELVAVTDENLEERRSSLRRFECGHVLTRIVCKGAYALGILKQFEDELSVLEALLAQKKWRRGRRGGWHERKALIFMTHMEKSDTMYEKAHQAVIEGLEDEDTHIVYRPSLERRLTRLEKKLKLPEHECHVCEAKLEKASEEWISGVRIHHAAKSLKLDKSLKPVNPQTKPASDGPKLFDLSLLKPPDSAIKIKPELERRHSGKSIWCGRDNEEVTVEMYALQSYEDRGFKGFHCEGRIVTTLFGLLFWDILFAPIPGAFETEYQSAPLDIAEDTFYLSRKSLIDKRIQEIRDGEAPAIIERFDDRHRPTQTWCVGIRWNLFEKQDLLEIAKCLGGDGVATICQLLCEDYASRTSGVPDLIVWNADETEGKFVEVKGPGDNLQENQKVWIDVLVRAGVPVEVCHVAEQGEGKKHNSKTKVKRAATPKTKKRKRRVSPTPEPDSTDDEEIAPIKLSAESEDEEEHPPPPPTLISTPMEPVVRSRDKHGPCFIAAIPLDSRTVASESPKTRKRIEVLLPSPRPFKRSRRAPSA